MRPNKARFVTACQQILALGAVLAVVAPAANVISLDVVGTRPGAQAPQSPERDAAPDATPIGDRDEEADEADESEVETAPVEPVVKEYQLTAAATDEQAAEPQAPGKSTTAPRRATGSDSDDANDTDTDSDSASDTETEILSDVEEVTGYGAVGVTWNHGEEIAEEDISVEFRTRTDGTWSQWTPTDYHDEHGPEADSAEAGNDRPGTDALLIGEVDEVQAKVVLAAGVDVPDDMSLAVIAPGSGTTEKEQPAIDTGDLDTGQAGKATADGTAEGDVETGAQTEVAAGDGTTLRSSDGDLELKAGSYTPKPKIYSRAQWGANERMRDPGSLRYYEVHAGFVHHTVNANNYSRAQVPGIIRSIYAYHTQSRGWSDIGYNFLVDKFGRVWEGRYGGVDRPVVGAHTLGYNDYSFAMSAIGNFETARPTSKMIDAYARLFAWKLSLHGIDAASTSQRVGNRTFKAINGHRDAGSTACPGRYLYAKIPTIRSKAAHYQADWSGRSLATDVVGSAYPDILMRRTSDNAGVALPTQGLLRWKGSKARTTGWAQYDVIVATPDLTGDKHSDVLVRNAKTGVSSIRPGNGNGGFGAPVTQQRNLIGFDQITAVGNFNRSKRNDFVARRTKTGQLYLFKGLKDGRLRKTLMSSDWGGYDLTAATGDVNGDGIPDLYSRDRQGRLWFHGGTGRKGLKAPVKVADDWSGYDVITGFGDMTGDGIGDLYVRKSSTHRALVFPGRRNGSLGHWLGPFGKIGTKTQVSAANVTGTDDPDVIARKGDTLRVIVHNGTQNVSAPVVTTRAKIIARTDALLNVGDWDRDGHGDFVARHARTGKLKLIRGLGNNKFAKPVTVGGGGWGNVRLLAAVGDTTGDGYPDLMGQPTGKAMRIYPGSGTGFKGSYVARGAISAAEQVGAGRWNADGAPDNLFRVGNKLVLYAGNGPGGLTGSPLSLKGASLAGYDWVISAGDINRNGRPDLVVRKKVDGTLWFLSGKRTGYGKPKFLAEGFSGYDLAG